MKKIKFKFWIEEDDAKFYGPGPNQLLKEIYKEGSLSKAAGQMNLSYRKAWELVQRLNHHSKEPLIVLKKGGPHGGGAEITPRALKVIEEYDILQKKIDELVEQQHGLIKVLE